MATIRRPAPAGNSTWDYLRHAADSVCQSAGAHLSGNFIFTFANASPWTAKLHLAEDTGGGADAAGSQQRSDYFLTVPSGAAGVEVPLTCGRVRVTAGFFRPATGDYEIFWESRPFAWEPGCTVAMAARHSVDVNRVRADVWPGALLSRPGHREVAAAAPLAHLPKQALMGPPANAALRQIGQAPLRLLALLPEPPTQVGRPSAKDDPLSLSMVGLQVFSRDRNGWAAGVVSRELPDGSLEIRGANSEVVLAKPEAQPTLLRVPALETYTIGTLQGGTEFFTIGTQSSLQSQGSTMSRRS